MQGIIKFVKRPLTVLLLIFLLAGILRLYKLDKYPVGFHIDEASLGYNGYSLLKTGKDEHGNRFPLYIDMFGDYRPSGYHFLTVVPIAIFGLNEFATRLPGALFGSLSVLAFFSLILTLFKDKKLALLSSFLLAVSPWHIVLSRASAETIVALFFILLGFSLSIRSLIEKNIPRMVIGALFLCLSYFFYHTPRVFVPLLYFCIVLFFRSELRAKFSGKRVHTIVHFALMVCISLFLVSAMLVFSIKGGTGRFSQVSIFGFPETRLVMEEQYREDGVRSISPVVARFFHNKIINYSLTFISNYFEYFDGQLFFIKGGLPIWYKVPGMGLFYIAFAPFLILGFAATLKMKNPYAYIVFLWLVVAPIPASITFDDMPNIQRAVNMFPMIDLLIALGLLSFYSHKYIWNKILTVLVLLAVAYNFAYFYHQYFVHGSTHATMYRTNGFKAMVESVKKDYDQYDSIVITKTLGGIYPNVLFHMQYDPATYQKEGSPQDRDFGGFGKFIFTPQYCPAIDGGEQLPKKGNIIFVNSGTCTIAMEHENIYREDGTLAFIIVRRKLN